MPAVTKSQPEIKKGSVGAPLLMQDESRYLLRPACNIGLAGRLAKFQCKLFAADLDLRKGVRAIRAVVGYDSIVRRSSRQIQQMSRSFHDDLFALGKAQINVLSLTFP